MGLLISTVLNMNPLHSHFCYSQLCMICKTSGLSSPPSPAQLNCGFLLLFQVNFPPSCPQILWQCCYLVCRPPIKRVRVSSWEKRLGHKGHANEGKDRHQCLPFGFTVNGQFLGSLNTEIWGCSSCFHGAPASAGLFQYTGQARLQGAYQVGLRSPWAY